MMKEGEETSVPDHPGEKKKRKIARWLYLLLIAAFQYIIIFHKDDLLPVHSSTIFTIVLAAANLAWIFFVTGVLDNKAWIFSVIGEGAFEEVHFSERNFHTLFYSLFYGVAFILYCVAFILMVYYFVDQRGNFTTGLCLIAVTLSVWFACRMLVRAMGVYIFWIARVDGEKFKTEIPNSLILEKLSWACDDSHQGAELHSKFLVLFLIVYICVESTPAWRIGFALCFVLLFCMAGMSLFLSQLYENCATWLQMTTPINFFDEKTETVLRKRLSDRLTFLKFLFGLLLLGEAVAFFSLLKFSG